MDLRLVRYWRAPRDTIGALSVDGVFVCFTLEDQVRTAGVKVPGQTAIPAGIYRLVITPSERFKEDLSLLLDVPGFEGIRIHAGNTREDTEGCILVGQMLIGTSLEPASVPSFRLGNSRAALNALLPTLRAGIALSGGSTAMTIVDA